MAFGGKIIFGLAVLFCAASPVFWWVFGTYFPKIAYKDYDLFLFVNFKQQGYWYVFYTFQHLSEVITAYYLDSFNPYMTLRPVTKWLLWYQIFRLVEYWLYHGSLPLLPLLFALMLAILQVLFIN